MAISEYQVTDVIEGKTSMEKPGCEKPTEVLKVEITSDNFKNLKIYELFRVRAGKLKPLQSIKLSMRFNMHEIKNPVHPALVLMTIYFN